MSALCVSGAVNTQGFVWKFFYALYINFHSFIHSFNLSLSLFKKNKNKKNIEHVWILINEQQQVGGCSDVTAYTTVTHVDFVHDVTDTDCQT